MKTQVIALLSLLMVSSVCAQKENPWMDSVKFAYIEDALSWAVCEVRYASDYNFVGAPITGYHTEKLVMTQEAVTALQKAEQRLYKLGYGLKIFDTYRPQRAVNHFIAWSKRADDTLTKSTFYPEQDKSNLFDLGYISRRSGHSRGSTIDLTLYHLDDGSEVDMGGPYDYFGEISHLGYEDISKTQKQNREILRSIMSASGFRSYSKEWWHYTLRNEPYPKTFFDFVVE